MSIIYYVNQYYKIICSNGHELTFFIHEMEKIAYSILNAKNYPSADFKYVDNILILYDKGIIYECDLNLFIKSIQEVYRYIILSSKEERMCDVG